MANLNVYSVFTGRFEESRHFLSSFYFSLFLSTRLYVVLTQKNDCFAEPFARPSVSSVFYFFAFFFLFSPVYFWGANRFLLPFESGSLIFHVYVIFFVRFLNIVRSIRRRHSGIFRSIYISIEVRFLFAVYFSF